MPRYIDADKLRKESKMLYSIHAFEPVEAYTQDQIDAAPTVDLVPRPVKCGECEYLETLYTEAGAVGHCNLGERETFGCKPDDFCSCGKRKDGAE